MENKKRKLCFFSYIGGKNRLVDTLLPLIPRHTTYVEVFGGAANLLLNKPQSPVEVYNDIDGDLVNLFRVAREQPEKLIQRLKLQLYNRAEKIEWSTAPLPKDDQVEAAARFYFVLRASFSGVFRSGKSWRKCKTDNIPAQFARSVEGIKAIAERLRNVYIECTDFRDCIKTWDSPETLLFNDPPYFGLNYYRYRMQEKDHIDLLEILKKTKGKWLLTYNDRPIIRELYREFPMFRVEMLRSSANIQTGKKRTYFGNLIIANYNIKKPEDKNEII